MSGPIKIGDQIWFVPYSGTGRWITVVKVGRKWLTTDSDWQFAKSGLAPNYDYRRSCYGDAYRTVEDYQAHVKAEAVKSAWGAFKRRVSRHYPLPSSLTIEAIQQAELLLFGEQIATQSGTDDENISPEITPGNTIIVPIEST